MNLSAKYICLEFLPANAQFDHNELFKRRKSKQCDNRTFIAQAITVPYVLRGGLQHTSDVFGRFAQLESKR